MPEVSQHQPGMFSWADLATTDSKAALSFYKELFGWTSIDIPIDDQGNYSRLEKDGKAVCALYDMGAEMKEQGVPPSWTPYFTVTDVDDVLARVGRLGGAVLQGPHDVFTAGRMAACRAPDGASFAVWQPRDEIGAQVFGEPCSLNWCELYTDDPQAQSEFYAGVFGWQRVDTTGAGEQPYYLFQVSGENAAGMMQLDLAPAWTVYFGVDDCDRSMEKALAMGATLQNRPWTSPV